MNKELYFRIYHYNYCGILNPQSNDSNFCITIEAYKYHSDTKHPSDLGKKYYYKHSHNINIYKNKIETVDKSSFAYGEIIMITPDYRVSPKTEEQAIKLVKDRFGWSN